MCVRERKDPALVEHPFAMVTTKGLLMVIPQCKGTYSSSCTVALSRLGIARCNASAPASAAEQKRQRDPTTSARSSQDCSACIRAILFCWRDRKVEDGMACHVCHFMCFLSHVRKYNCTHTHRAVHPLRRTAAVGGINRQDQMLPCSKSYSGLPWPTGYSRLYRTEARPFARFCSTRLHAALYFFLPRRTVP